MIVRQMQETDLPRIMEIERAAYPFPWTVQNIKDCLHGVAKVFELDDNLIGYGLMSIAADEADILNLCIHPLWQSRGYGQFILKHLLELAKQKNVKFVYLEVRVSNKAAIKLYHQTGFKQIGERKRYYQNGDNREDALILALKTENLNDLSNH